MGDKTGISWTDSSWNPVTGCTRVSEGCRHCYAEALAATRLKDSPRYKGLAVMTPAGPRWTGKINLHPELLDLPRHWRKPRRIFVNSMSDLFHPAVPPEFVEKIFAVMKECPQHCFQILSKRPYEMAEFVDDHAPVPNAWFGASVEDQKTAQARLAGLLQIQNSRNLFVSAEPLLESVSFVVPNGHKIKWIILGGESGPNARPFWLDWAWSIRFECRAFGIPFFFKQAGSHPQGEGCEKIKHRSGADPAEWPEDLRVQEFPEDEK